MEHANRRRHLRGRPAHRGQPCRWRSTPAWQGLERVAQRRAGSSKRLGTAQSHLHPQPGRSCGSAIRTEGGARRGAACRWAPVVHEHLRTRQRDHEPPGPTLRPRSGPNHPARSCPMAGDPRRRLPRRRAGQDPARASLRRALGVRREAALAVLRGGGRDASVPDPARRVLLMDG